VEEQRGESRWRTLGGKPQTDALFEKEIVERMGRAFYETTFMPAVREALQKGQRYEAIRDTLRRQWDQGGT